MSNDFLECHCICHTGDFARHCVPCCSQCPTCLRNISYGIDYHFEQCRKESEALVVSLKEALEKSQKEPEAVELDRLIELRDKILIMKDRCHGFIREFNELASNNKEIYFTLNDCRILMDGVTTDLMLIDNRLTGIIFKRDNQ